MRSGQSTCMNQFTFFSAKIFHYSAAIKCDLRSLCTNLLESPLPVLLDDVDAPLLVQAQPASVEDGTSGNGVLQRRQPALVQIIERDHAVLEVLDGIDKLLKRDVAVAGLAGEVAPLVWGVLHVESDV